MGDMESRRNPTRDRGAPKERQAAWLAGIGRDFEAADSGLALLEEMKPDASAGQVSAEGGSREGLL